MPHKRIDGPNGRGERGQQCGRETRGHCQGWNRSGCSGLDEQVELQSRKNVTHEDSGSARKGVRVTGDGLVWNNVGEWAAQVDLSSQKKALLSHGAFWLQRKTKFPNSRLVSLMGLTLRAKNVETKQSKSNQRQKAVDIADDKTTDEEWTIRDTIRLQLSRTDDSKNMQAKYKTSLNYSTTHR